MQQQVTAATQSIEQRDQTSAAPEQRALAVFRLRGSQAAMGEQHAAALLRLGGYEHVVEFYAELPERIILHADAKSRPNWVPRKLARGLKEVLLGRLQRQRPAAYVERSHAFMETLGMPASHAKYLGVMDLMQNIVGIVGRLRFGPFSRIAAEAAVPACSTLMAWGDATESGGLLHARNFDFPGIGVWDRAPALVFCDPDEGLRYGFATSRGADTPGVSAFNEAGITVTMHTRFHRDISFDGAMVVDIGHDIARRAETIDDAIAIVRERRVASTWGIAVSSAREKRAVVIETTARKVAVVEPAHVAGQISSGAEGDHLSCANRYRHPDTIAGQVAASATWDAHSTGRQGRLVQLVAQARPRGGMTVVDMQDALNDHTHPVASQAARGAGAVVSQPCTVKSLVVDPEAEAIHISVGPAPTSRGPFVRVDWSWEGEVGGVEFESTAAAHTDVSAHDQAITALAEASRLDRQEHNWRGALVALERAVALQPEDPSFRFLAGGLRLKSCDFERGLEHLEAGLLTETIPLRRGELLLWASRAAEATNQPVRAQQLRAELLAMDHDALVEHRELASREERRPRDLRKHRIQLNLLIGDAW